MKPSLASAPTVITCHSNADWDALSSMIGMSMIYPDSIMIFPGSMEKPLNPVSYTHLDVYKRQTVKADARPSSLPSTTSRAVKACRNWTSPSTPHG